MKILAIETASKVCGVSLLEDNNLIKEAILEDENTHSVKLMPLIDGVLTETKVNIKDIDLFACDKGPGSFTGIRIGIATIKAFADATAKKVIGITSLESLAYGEKKNEVICSMIDAKNENVYYGFFHNQDGKYQKIDELQFGNIDEVLKKAEDLKKHIIFVGDGSISYQEQIKNYLGEKAEFSTQNKLNPTNIGKLAFLKKEEACDTNHLSPDYLRMSNAERQRLEK